MTPWIRLELQHEEATGQLFAQITDASGGLRTPRRAAHGVKMEELLRFSAAIANAGAGKGRMNQAQRAWARDLYQRVFDGDRGSTLDRLRGTQGSVLVRLFTSDPLLRAVPWEVMRGPGETDPSVAVSVRLQVARGVYSNQPATPEALRGAVRVLAVGANSTRSLVEDLGVSLAPSVEAGLLEWLPPSVGKGATWPALLARLQRPPHPQVLHFIVHGGVRQGQPALLLDEDHEEWLDVELLAATLAELEGAGPRLVYLQSCSGAKPGELASAAEHIAMVGPQAVVAHQWDVRANLSRVVARAFYGELVGPAVGDVAVSLSRARLSLAGRGTAEFLSPVLFLRGDSTQLFRFRRLGEAALEPGEEVERYTVIGPAQGAPPAECFEVRHSTLGTRHTLKVLHLQSDAARDQLRARGAALARMRHPHILGVTDVLEVKGEPALLSPRVEGVWLDTLLATEPLPQEQALRIFRGVLGGVAHAHTEGLAHGGLCAARVALERAEDGAWRPFVDGFIQSAVGRSLSSEQLPYVAPEQREGGHADAVGDVFSLGVLLLELLTGARPAEAPGAPGDVSIEVLLHSRGLSGLPSPLRRALEGSLAPNPAERFPDAVALITCLDESPVDGDPGAASERVGDFDLLEELGRGGMGVVYKAHQISLGRTVALKILPRSLAQDEVAKARFFREIRALSRVVHPNLVGVQTHGELDGVPYFTMEYIDGADLSAAAAVLSGWMQTGTALREGHVSEAVSWSEQRRLPAAAPVVEPPALPSGQRDLWRRLAELFADAADALHALHEAGVVHRDVKPSNLMLTKDGQRLVVMDLGLASVSDASRALTAPELKILGTLRYMPPEQLQRQLLEVDRRADVYALGATMMELVTGTPFLDGDSEQRLVQQILHEEPWSARERVPGLPVDLDTVLAHATAKRAADRYSTAAELAADLRALAWGAPVSVRRPGRLRRALYWARQHPVPATMMLSLFGFLSVAVVIGGASIGLGLLLLGDRSKCYGAVDERWGGYAGSHWAPAWNDRACSVRVQIIEGRPTQLVIEEPRGAREAWDETGTRYEQTFQDGWVTGVTVYGAAGDVRRREQVDCAPQEDGRVRCMRRYQDAQALPSTHPELGVHLVEQLLDAEGRVTTIRAWSEDGARRVPMADGVWERRLSRDEAGVVAEERYFGSDDRPQADEGGCFGLRWPRLDWNDLSTDEPMPQGVEVLLPFKIPWRLTTVGLDAAGEPAPCLDGVHQRRTVMARNGEPWRGLPGLTELEILWETEHRDLDGALTRNEDGHAVALWLNQELRAAPPLPETLPLPESVADRRALCAYDEVTVVATLDEEGEPIGDLDGVAATRRWRRDGRTVARQRLDTEGAPVVGADGWAAELSCRDEARFPLIATYGDDGEPVSGEDGAFVQLQDFDEAGRLTLRRWVDDAGQPTPNDEGVASARWTYGDGLVVDVLYEDVSGQPVDPLSLDRAHTVLSYDGAGRLLTLATFDAQGSPAGFEGDWPSWRIERDAFGRVQARTGGEPRCDGVLREVWTRGADARVAEVRFTDLAGQPVTSNMGVHVVELERDPLGVLLVTRYRGLDGEPAQDASGCAAWSWEEEAPSCIDPDGAASDPAGAACRIRYGRLPPPSRHVERTR